MVLYEIKSKRNGIDEWSVIELQGELEIRNGGQNFDTKYFGDLHYKNGKPVLILGHHILNGEVKKLDKPYAVLEKQNANEKELKVKAIVKEKIVFKTRPNPIITYV